MELVPSPAAITHFRYLDRPGANAGLDHALWQVAVAYHGMPAPGIPKSLQGSKKCEVDP